MSIVLRKITEEDLAIAIDFLKNGFNWSENKSIKIKNFILNQIKKYHSSVIS